MPILQAIVSSSESEVAENDEELAEPAREFRLFSNADPELTPPSTTFARLGISYSYGYSYSYTMSEGINTQEPNDSNLTPDEANRIIHSHRKVRYGKPNLAMSSYLPLFRLRKIGTTTPQTLPMAKYFVPAQGRRAGLADSGR
jgi:hypothetical protein